MVQGYTLELCLLDTVPILAFLVGGVFLVRLAILSEDRGSILIMAGGVALVFLGGAFQVTWKFLYTLGLGDPRWLSDLQFVLLAPGFVLLLVSTVLLARLSGLHHESASMAMAPWKIPLLGVMTLCSLGTHGMLAYLSFRRGARLATILYIAAVLCMLGMAGLAGGEQTISRQWLEQSVNAVGQIAFAEGSYLLYRRSAPASALE
jgi:hypothetical protein